MEDKFSRYVKSVLKENPDAFLAGIPISRIRKDHLQWQMRTQDRYVCVMVRDSNERMFTAVGVGGNLKEILLENSKKPQNLHSLCTEPATSNPSSPSSLSSSSLAVNSNTQIGCKLAAYLSVPPYTNFSATELRERCLSTGKRWNTRCRTALLLAKTHGLRCSISSEVLDERSNLYVHSVASFHRSNNNKRHKLQPLLPLSSLAPRTVSMKRT